MKCYLKNNNYYVIVGEYNRFSFGIKEEATVFDITDVPEFCRMNSNFQFNIELIHERERNQIALENLLRTVREILEICKTRM